MRKPGKARVIIFALAIASLGAVTVTRLFLVQIRGYAEYKSRATGQTAVSEELFPKRGELFLQERSKVAGGGESDVVLVPAAVNKRGYSAFAVPKDVPKERVEEASTRIAEALDMDRALITSRLEKRSDPYEPLKRRLSDEEVQALQALGIPGVRFERETWREYPQKELTAALTGFLGASRGEVKGLYGLEKRYEDVLAGVRGYRAAEKDALGTLLPFRIHEERPAVDGSSLVLTVDANIQFAARNILRDTLEKRTSPGGVIIVLEPTTGRILALATEPTYDPNDYRNVEDLSRFMNPAVEAVFEPGSVFKPVTMAAGLDAKLVTPKTTYTDDGVVQFGSYTIRNFDNKAYGVRTMAEVIELSLNTGVVYVQRLLGKDRFAAAVHTFGFGEKSGVDLPGELAGNLANLGTKGAEVNFATAAFGQGVSVTPLQMANAIAVIANGGTLMRPYVVEKIVRPDGSEEVMKPQAVRRVIGEETAKQMARIMVDAVRGKFEKRADVPGYFVAGKTGTAQIPSGGGYLPVEQGVIHTFVGFAPAFAPRFVVFIKMERPREGGFAANTLTQPFHDLASFLLNYYNVPPDEPDKVGGAKKAAR